MRIRSENLSSLMPKSSSREPAHEVTKDAPLVDGFRQSVATSSPFSARKSQPVVDPFIDITTDVQRNQTKWWNDELERLLPLPFTLPSGELSADMMATLRLVARDQGYLNINWRDDC